MSILMNPTTRQSTPDPMPQGPYKDYQTRAPISGNHKKWIDTGLARIVTTSYQSEATCAEGRGTSVL